MSFPKMTHSVITSRRYGDSETRSSESQNTLYESYDDTSEILKREQNKRGVLIDECVLSVVLKGSQRHVYVVSEARWPCLPFGGHESEHQRTSLLDLSMTQRAYDATDCPCDVQSVENTERCALIVGDPGILLGKNPGGAFY